MVQTRGAQAMAFGCADIRVVPMSPPVQFISHSDAESATHSRERRRVALAVRELSQHVSGQLCHFGDFLKQLDTKMTRMEEKIDTMAEKVALFTPMIPFAFAQNPMPPTRTNGNMLNFAKEQLPDTSSLSCDKAARAQTSNGISPPESFDISSETGCDGTSFATSSLGFTPCAEVSAKLPDVPIKCEEIRHLQTFPGDGRDDMSTTCTSINAETPTSGVEINDSERQSDEHAGPRSPDLLVTSTFASGKGARSHGGKGKGISACQRVAGRASALPLPLRTPGKSAGKHALRAEIEGVGCVSGGGKDPRRARFCIPFAVSGRCSCNRTLSEIWHYEMDFFKGFQACPAFDDM